MSPEMWRDPNNFPFLLQKIDTTLKGVCLLLTAIYDHTEYGNVHLQMTPDDTFFATGGGDLSPKIGNIKY